MPEMDGFELLSHMNSGFSDIPAIVMTGYASPEYNTRLAQLGIFNIIEKPIDLDLLQKEITRGRRGCATRPAARAAPRHGLLRFLLYRRIGPWLMPFEKMRKVIQAQSIAGDY